MARTTRVGLAALLTVAATMGVTGTAMAKHGADDPPGDDRGAHVAGHDAGDDHGGLRARGRGADDRGRDDRGGARRTRGGDDRAGDDRGGLRRANGSDDVRRAGTCSGASAVKIKLSPEDGRIEAEAEVDQNRNGVTWAWRMTRGTATLASGRAITRAPSGSFEVRRVVSDTAGSDTIAFRATSPSGEVCTARATLS